MLFNSLAFAVFLPIVFILYWMLPHRFRWVLLLAASYYFYMSWNVKYVALILFTTVVSYLAALLIEKLTNRRAKKTVLVITSVLCLGVLFFFKYFNFVSTSLCDLLSLFAVKLNPITLKLLLPVGISFYTFQTLSYVIDVYRGDIKAERHFGYYATFISFFPQLVAGPIERAENLLPQIKAENRFDYGQAAYGLKLMAWGFFKKLVIADVLSPCVSAVYNAPQGATGFALVLATFFFTIQIYCDFSGYSDIAIGTSKLMGIDLMTNFKSPYFSQSIKEFWSRWHTSLSTWFRDYVYIPLGGNRVGKLRHSINLMATFLISGLWHGASWTFVIWGGIHGFAQVAENALTHGKGKSPTIASRLVKTLVVFVFVAFAWIFFVANSIEDAVYVIMHMFTGITSPVSYLHDGFILVGLDKLSFFWITASLALLAIYDYCSLRYDVIEAISNKKVVIRWAVYVLFMLYMLLNLPVSNATEFIYFQF